MDRRQFLFSVPGLSLMLTTPTLGLDHNSTSSSLSLPVSLRAAVAQAPLEIPAHIQMLEAQLRAQNGHFNWWLHNELRHHYGPVSEMLSRQHSDIILAHSLMDGYILSTLSDWHLPTDPGLAIAVLINNAQNYPDFFHVQAACLIKAGDVYQQNGQFLAAQTLYRQVLNLNRFALMPTVTLEPYRVLAQNRLTLPLQG